MTNIESSISAPRADTQHYLQQALEKGGVEFLSGEGVRLRDEVLEIHKYEGEEALHVLFTDIFTVCPQGGEMVDLSVNERYFLEKGHDLIVPFYREMKKRKMVSVF